MKIAIITFAALPLPAVKGGAIETLIQTVCDVNEKEKKLNITVFSSYNKLAFYESKKYRFTKFVYVKKTVIAIIHNYFFRFLRVLSFKAKTFYSFELKFVANKINKECFNFVVVQGGGKHVPALKKLIKNNKIILNFQSDPLHYLSLKDLKKIVNCCNKVICPNNFIKSRVIEADPLSSGKLYFVKSCTDLTLPSKSKIDIFKKNFFISNNISKSDKIILFCGRLVPEKGVKELLLSLESIDRRDIVLIITGSAISGSNTQNSFVKSLETIASRTNIKIVFTGFATRSDLPLLYSISDIAVVPSIINDASPLSSIEAQIFGLPIVATKIGGIPETVNSEASVLVEYDDNFVENLRNAILKTLKDEKMKNIALKHSLTYIEKNNMHTYYFSFVQALFSGR